MYIYIYIIYIYIHILRSSYRKLAWVGFKFTTTEFKPCVQLALRVIFQQLLQFHLFVQCSRLTFAIAFVSRYICFERNFAQVITRVQRNKLIHIIFTTEGFWEVSIEIWPELDLNRQPLNSGHAFNLHPESTFNSYSNFISLFSVHV